MDEKCEKFVESLIKCSEGLRGVYNETLSYWNPDAPPITVLFGALGDQIAESFDETKPEVNQFIFNLIESAMGSGDSNLMTAVATGLIEAMIATSTRKEGLWQRVSPMLGKLSRNHAEAWIGG